MFLAHSAKRRKGLWPDTPVVSPKNPAAANHKFSLSAFPEWNPVAARFILYQVEPEKTRKEYEIFEMRIIYCRLLAVIASWISFHALSKSGVPGSGMKPNAR